MVARKIRRRCRRVCRRVCSYSSGKLSGKALTAFRRKHPRIQSGPNKGQFKSR